MASKFANSNVGPGTAPQESSCSLNQICPPARVSEAYGIRRQIASWDLASAPIFRSNLRNFTSTERGPAMKIVLGGLMLLAHSWYPWACCHDQHCHPVPCETIKAHGLGLSLERRGFHPRDDQGLAGRAVSRLRRYGREIPLSLLRLRSEAEASLDGGDFPKTEDIRIKLDRRMRSGRDASKGEQHDRQLEARQPNRSSSASGTSPADQGMSVLCQKQTSRST